MNGDKSGFTFKELKLWEAIDNAQRPEPPTITQCMTAPMVQSYTARMTRRGMTISIVVEDGNDVTLNLNAFLCAALLSEIAKTGYQMEWLERDGTPKPNL
jgi:hypothetical protein